MVKVPVDLLVSLAVSAWEEAGVPAPTAALENGATMAAKCLSMAGCECGCLVDVLVRDFLFFLTTCFSSLTTFLRVLTILAKFLFCLFLFCFLFLLTLFEN